MGNCCCLSWLLLEGQGSEARSSICRREDCQMKVGASLAAIGWGSQSKWRPLPGYFHPLRALAWPGATLDRYMYLLGESLPARYRGYMLHCTPVMDGCSWACLYC